MSTDCQPEIAAIAKRRVDALIETMGSAYDGKPYDRRDALRTQLETRGTSAVGREELRLLEELCAELDAENEAEHRAEMWAENAWLRHAEAGTAEDMAFERYENEMGLY